MNFREIISPSLASLADFNSNPSSVSISILLILSKAEFNLTLKKFSLSLSFFNLLTKYYSKIN
ncbi:MAG: hypothetical protein ACLU1X_05135, partial [Peptoniphilus grossensis]